MLWDCNTDYYRAWITLQKARTSTGTMAGVYPNGVPYSEISCYAKDHGLAGTLEDLDDAVFMIQAMDDEYIKWCNEVVKQQSKTKG